MAHDPRLTVPDFVARKASGQRIAMVTCYDYASARVLDASEADCLLVGDSLAMVMHGFDSTVHADIDLMALHVRAVARGAPSKFIVGDMPFLSVRKGLGTAMDGVQALMQSGAQAVKIEGEAGHVDLIAHVVESGVPVMGHLGLTPQSVHGLGGHKVQGRSEDAARQLVASARRLVDAGCFSIVLEVRAGALAARITREVPVPIIGIGAGAGTDGQVLVLHDLLGMDPGFKPRFVRRYADGFSGVRDAVDAFARDVRDARFPSCEEAYA